jgi:hypothetical protein
MLVGGLLAGSALAGGTANNTTPGARAVPAGQFSATKAIGVKGAAVINPDGSVARGSKLPFAVVSAKKLLTGEYEVIFNKSVAACAYTATIGLAGSSGISQPGTTTVVGRNLQPKGVYVTTRDSSGAALDLGFHLIVTC